MLSPIKEIKSFLSNYPNLDFVEDERSIAVLPKDYLGFKVQLKQLKNGYILSYGNWHEYLPNHQNGAKVAINLFKFGLSDSCRLTIKSRGKVDYKCDLSFKEQNSSQWMVIAKQKLVIYPFWQSEYVKELKNDLISIDQLSDLFETDEFEKVLTQISYERKYSKYALYYSIIWTAVFLKLNNFDFENIQISLIGFTPVIFITLLLPVLMMRNWFDDRKYGKIKKLNLSRKQKKFLFVWISLWSTALLIVAIIWGAMNLIALAILGLPFIIVAFFIPIFVMMERK